jgi:hypothetical protein
LTYFLFLGEPADTRQGSGLVSVAQLAIQRGHHIAVGFNDVMSKYYLSQKGIPFTSTWQRRQVRGGIVFGRPWLRLLWLRRLRYIA